MVFAMFSAVVAWEATFASFTLLTTVGTKTAARIAMIAAFHDKKHPFLLDYFIILLFWTVEKEKRDEKSSL